MVDLTNQLPRNVLEYNELNPGSPVTLLGKCEFHNPGMSHKDRIAKAMLENAEKRGDLTNEKGGKKIILAASSGNTGCSLALVGKRERARKEREWCCPVHDSQSPPYPMAALEKSRATKTVVASPRANPNLDVCFVTSRS